MMKVLYVATVYSHICEFHLPFLEFFKRKGFEVHVAGRDNLAEKAGRKLEYVDRAFNIPFMRSPFAPSNIKAYFQLKKIIRSGNYNLIVCNTPVGGAAARLAARKIRKSGTKVFYIAHGFHFYRGAPLFNWIFYYPFEKILSKISDGIITITDEDFSFARKHFLCPVSHIHGIGVDEKIFFPVSAAEKRLARKNLGLSGSGKLLLCVGEFNTNKNQQLAIRALPGIVEKYPDVKLLFAGTGALENRLRDLATRLNIADHLVFLGYSRRINEYQRAVDVVVSCSLREGLPLNIVEAMMSGNPVVATDNRGHRELMNDNRNGFLVPVNDFETMGKRVVEFLDDPLLCQSKTGNASAFIAPYQIGNVLREYFFCLQL